MSLGGVGCAVLASHHFQAISVVYQLPSLEAAWGIDCGPSRQKSYRATGGKLCGMICESMLGLSMELFEVELRLP